MQWAAGGAAAGAALTGVIAWYALPTRQDWQAAAAFVSARAAADETVVVVPERARPALAYYDPDARLMLEAHGNGAWVVIAGGADQALRAARTVVTTPRYALLDQRAFGDELVVQHWVRP